MPHHHGKIGRASRSTLAGFRSPAEVAEETENRILFALAMRGSKAALARLNAEKLSWWRRGVGTICGSEDFHPDERLGEGP